MAEQDRTTLKGYLETGDTPTEQEFADLIDSFLNRTDDSDQILPAPATGDASKIPQIKSDESGYESVPYSYDTIDTSSYKNNSFNIIHNPAENTITGEGAMNYILSGGYIDLPNQITANLADNDFLMAIITGYDNTITNSLASMMATQHGTIQNPASHASIWGGSFGTIDAGEYNAIVGGTQNSLSADRSVIITSDNCSTNSGAAFSFLASSDQSTIDTDADKAVIIGCDNSIINNNGKFSSIISARDSSIGDTSQDCIILNGSNNVIGDNAVACMIKGKDGDIANGVSHGFILGEKCEVNESYGIATGKFSSSYFGGQRSHAETAFAETGDAQASDVILTEQTTDATPSSMTNSSFNRFVVPDGKAIFAKGKIIAKADNDDIASYEISATAYRPTGGSTIIKQNNVTAIYEDDANWDVSINNTGDAINIIVTGASATTINWVCTLDNVEVK